MQAAGFVPVRGSTMEKLFQHMNNESWAGVSPAS